MDAELEPVATDAEIKKIHRDLANYDLVAMPVIDKDRNLIGAVTVDDVLDHLLPDDWRSKE
jgi:Mg/Co/Ni transporter MgtE